MKDESARTNLENLIIEKSWRVKVSQPNAGWVEDEEFEDFLASWSDLWRYYTYHSDDTVIGVEVLREYVHFTRLLRRVLLDHDIDAERREKADEALCHLEYMLEEIVAEVVAYLNSKDNDQP